jgi:hypothetical protein
MSSTFQSPRFEDDFGLSYKQRFSPIGIIGVRPGGAPQLRLDHSRP